MTCSVNRIYIIAAILISLFVSNMLFILCKEFLLDLQRNKDSSSYSLEMEKMSITDSVFNLLSKTVFFGVGWVEYQENSKKSISVTQQKESKKDTSIDLDKLILDSLCAINNKDDLNYYSENCDRWVKEQLTKETPLQAVGEKNTEQSQKGDALKEVIKGSLLIKAIEYLLILTLGVQLFLTIYTFLPDKSPKFDKYVFHLSDFAINTSPILGVMANLASFALLVKNAANKSGNIMDYFPVYFFDAVITTLIGAIFYIICLGLKVFILPRIEDNIV